ncbi:MAG: enhanced intracellular survival protein Eis [Halobacteriales archaeon]
MPSYRPLTDDEEGRFRAYTRYAFSPDVDPDELPDGPRREGDRRGLFPDAGSRPLSVCAHHWFGADVRGRRLDTPGLSAVATPPEFRRRGHVRELLAHCLEEYHERGSHLSLLWPFKHAFYRDLGWERAYRYVAYELDPGALLGVAERDRGTMHPADDPPLDDLDAIYRAATAGLDLAVDRSASWWRHRVLDGWAGEPHLYVWRDDADDARGYVVFRIEREGSDRELLVDDLAAGDPEAFRQVWRFLANHDSQVARIRAHAPADAALLDHLATRDGVEVTLREGIMARLVDARRTLSALAYPEAAAGSVVLGVRDDLVDWHDEPLHLEVTAGGADCEPTDADPDAVADVATLSALAVGARPAGALAAADRLEADPAVVETLEALFPPRRSFCQDFF